jgi:DNA uptake protein ComE-like DNA-binding protein
MEESFRHKFKEYFYFLKKDRIGIIVLILLILLTIGGHFIIERIEIRPHADITDMIKEFEAWENEQKLKDESLKFFYFDPNTVSQEQFDSLPIPKYIKNNIIKYRSAGGSFQRPADLKKIYGMNDSIYVLMEPWLRFPNQASQVVEKKVKLLPPQVNKKFDPNTSTAEEMLLLGFKQFQVSNIEKYRRKGGRFYKPEDLLKVYGVDTNFYLALCENIQIEESIFPSIVETPNDNLRVELNAADSLTLIRLKGIGPVFASRIIKYRNLLGGFHSADQLLEVYGFPEKTFYELKEHFIVDTLSIEQVRINFAEYVELIRHPYIEKEHVEAVLVFRNKNGPFLTEEQLLTEGLIDSAAYMRVKPYITCR